MTAIESMSLKVSNTGSRIASCFNDADSAPKLVECAPPASTTIVTGSGARIIKREHTGANVAASNSTSGFTATHTVLVEQRTPQARVLKQRDPATSRLSRPRSAGMTESRYLAAVEGPFMSLSEFSIRGRRANGIGALVSNDSIPNRGSLWLEARYGVEWSIKRIGTGFDGKVIHARGTGFDNPMHPGRSWPCDCQRTRCQAFEIAPAAPRTM
jgi:hypothetical protein